MPDISPSPTVPALVPIVDDRLAVHAVLKAPAGEPQPMSTVCDLDVAGSLSLPEYTGGWRTVDSFHNAIGVTCLVCLGGLGARHTTPPVIVKGSWFPHLPPDLPGESDDAFTDRLTGAAAVKYLREHGADMDRLAFEDVLMAQLPPEVTIPYDHTRRRQCSINWHDECSDPAGERCQCPCHRQEPVSRDTADDNDAAEDWGDDLPQYAVLNLSAEVAAELHRAMVKFPGHHLPLGFDPKVTWIPGGFARADELRNIMRCMTDEAADRGGLTWLHVLAEEAFEAFAESDPAKARAELVQLAATAFRAILDIDNPRPVHYTGPSGVTWDEVALGVDGTAILAPNVNRALTPDGVAGDASTGAPGAVRG